MIKFLKTIYKWATGKTPMLPYRMIEDRYNTCFDCDEHKFGLFRTYCGDCKCTISEARQPFNKLAHPCEECPLQKWSKISGYECNE